MDGIKNIFDISARAMNAQMVRLNTVASNLANAKSVSATKEDAFRALRPVFQTEYDNAVMQSGISTVNVETVVSLDREPERTYKPGHPLADEQGYVWEAAINEDEEMVEMLEASRQYQNNIEVVNTLRNLMSRTVNMGK